MSLSYTAQKNEIPSVYVVEVRRYRNFEVVDGEADVLSDDEDDSIYGVFSNANECAIHVWNLMASDEVSEGNGPLSNVMVTLMPLDGLNPKESGSRVVSRLLACKNEEEVHVRVEALKL